MQIPMHIHRNDNEVYKVIEGAVDFNVVGQKTTLKSVGAILLPRKIPHTRKVVGSTNSKVYLDMISSCNFIKNVNFPVMSILFNSSIFKMIFNQALPFFLS